MKKINSVNYGGKVIGTGILNCYYDRIRKNPDWRWNHGIK